MHLDLVTSKIWGSRTFARCDRNGIAAGLHNINRSKATEFLSRCQLSLEDKVGSINIAGGEVGQGNGICTEHCTGNDSVDTTLSNC
jgi:hypothetical protein